MIADIIIAALGIFLVALMIYRFVKPPESGCCSRCPGNCKKCGLCQKAQDRPRSCKAGKDKK